MVTLDIGQGIAGWVAEHLSPLVIEDVQKDPRFFAGADKMTGFATKSIIAAPLVGRSGLIGVVEVINPGKKEYDHEIFELLCRQFAIAIENAIFYRESVERERLKQELEIAATLQKSFLPQPPRLVRNGLTVSAVNVSASKVGGDIYDFFELAPNRIGILIGDVSGKGFSAALYMARCLFDFRHIALREQQPDRALSHLNTLLLDAPRGMFLTAIYGVVDVTAGKLLLSVAGHPPFIRAGGQGTEAVSLPSGPPLGIVAEEYQAVELSLQRGERILLLTDGVFDAKNRAGERIGFERIAAVVREHRDAAEVIPRLMEYVNDFTQGSEPADDLTLVEIFWDPQV
jgi:sigma-B regulation protein RsbU (phosphoserine phosphatase)